MIESSCDELLHMFHKIPSFKINKTSTDAEYVSFSVSVLPQIYLIIIFKCIT